MQAATPAKMFTAVIESVQQSKRVTGINPQSLKTRLHIKALTAGFFSSKWFKNYPKCVVELVGKNVIMS